MADAQWLLESDPAVRWQVLRDVVGAPDSEVAAERARVETVGWGAQLLAARDPDGQWMGGACFPGRGERPPDGSQPWTSTLPVLMELVDLGLDPASQAARETIPLVARNCRWEYNDAPFFAGEVEACINGRTVTIGTYFGADVTSVVDYLLGDQLADGGWNCWVEDGATVSSFASTLNVVEGLLAWERATGGSDAVREARRRGEDYLLQRRLFRGLRSGEVVSDEWLLLTFPTRWHYDVLRALEHFRAAGVRDERLGEAIEILRAKRDDEGRWPLETIQPGPAHVDYEAVGGPSRWNTLRAQRVLDWWDAAADQRRS